MKRKIKLVKIDKSNNYILRTLHDKAALTMIGTFDDENNLQDILSQLSEYKGVLKLKKTVTFYSISGSLMNTFYHLTGRNRYGDKLNIVCIDPRCTNLSNVLTLVSILRNSQIRTYDDVVKCNFVNELLSSVLRDIKEEKVEEQDNEL